MNSELEFSWLFYVMINISKVKVKCFFLTLEGLIGVKDQRLVSLVIFKISLKQQNAFVSVYGLRRPDIIQR